MPTPESTPRQPRHTPGLFVHEPLDLNAVLAEMNAVDQAAKNARMPLRFVDYTTDVLAVAAPLSEQDKSFIAKSAETFRRMCSETGVPSILAVSAPARPVGESWLYRVWREARAFDADLMATGAFTAANPVVRVMKRRGDLVPVPRSPFVCDTWGDVSASTEPCATDGCPNDREPDSDHCASCWQDQYEGTCP